MRSAGCPENFRKDSLKNLLTKTKKEIREGSVFCSERDVQALEGILAGSEFSGFRFRRHPGNPRRGHRRERERAS